MEKRSQTPQALPKELPVLAVLGFSEPAEGDWARLRGLQYSCLGRGRPARIATQAAAVVATVAVLFGHMHPAAIGGWVVAVCAVLLWGTKVESGLADADRRRLTTAEIRRHAMTMVARAVVWAVPVCAFGPFINAQAQMKLWTVMAMLMTGCAVLVPGVPLGTLIFTGIVGGSTIAYFIVLGSYDMALVGLAFVGVIIAGAIESARQYLSTKVAEAGMHERDEVVSMLLREFEEGEADWLWQIDTARRVRAVSPRFAYALGRDAVEIEGVPFIQLIAGSAWDSGQFPPSLHDLAERLKRRESFSNLQVARHHRRSPALVGAFRHPEDFRQRPVRWLPRRRLGCDRGAREQRQDRLARPLRHPHRPAEPPDADRSTGRSAGLCRKVAHAMRFPDDRPRSLQGGERYARPLGW